MLSAFVDPGQRAKKKLAKTYGATAATAHSAPSSSASRSFKPSSQTNSDSSTSSQANLSQMPVKDVYDFDFVDDAPPPVTKTVPGPTRRLKPSPPAMTAGSKKPKALLTTKIPSSSEVKGVKRKPPQAEPAALRHQTNSTTQPKRSRQPSPSPNRDTLGFSPTKVTKTRPSSSPLTGSPSGQQTQKASPLVSTKMGSVRSPSASPRRPPPPSTMTGSAMRSSRMLQTAQRTSQKMPFRPLDNQSLDVATSQTKQRPAPNAVPLTPRAPSATPKHQSTQRKRRRLIDTLAAQMEGESSEEDVKADRKEDVASEDDEINSISDTMLPRRRNVRSTPVSEGRGTFMDKDSFVTASPGKTPVAPSTPTTITRRVTARRPGVKFTYSVERTMLAEEPVVLGGPQGSDLSLLESLLPEPEPKANAFDIDEDMGGASQGSIQSIHELRQAGANSRHADELVDIMDRVGRPSAGKPSSARRSALLEVVQKLQAKSFVRHFRDQGAEMQLLCEAGNEADVISGFSIACAMVALLASGPASHRFSHEFRQQKMKVLLSRLLDSDADIVTLAKDRKNNVSIHMRGQLVDAKSTLQKCPVWKPAAAPTQLSPRTAALKGLHMYAQQLQHMSGGVGGLDEDGGVLSPALTKQLFNIVSSTLPSAQDTDADGSSPPPSGQVLLLSGISTDAASVNLHLALSLLELHSVSAMQSDISAEWTRHYIPIVADALETSLRLPDQRSVGNRLNELELLVLKLAMNTANNNPDAARYYVEKGLLSRLATLSSAMLTAVIRSAKAGTELVADELNELLLMLGVMINFSENDASASETLMQGSGGLALFEQLGKSFLEGRALAAEADSEEKSQLNVAFAYLSILLGYFCLHDPVYEAFRKLSPSGDLRPLLESIRQFILLHDQLGKAENGEDAEMSHFTTRLRALADELDVRA